jgi:hypothetical protein
VDESRMRALDDDEVQWLYWAWELSAPVPAESAYDPANVSAFISWLRRWPEAKSYYAVVVPEFRRQLST